MAELLIAWTTADGEEHEERWASVERFLVWARSEGLRAAWSAYRQDEDGEWLLDGSGRC